MNEKISYRPDIDGLRAIAVLSVLFYHARIKFFSGGFVGVDIFFVISGFLITGIIVRELETKSFSIKKFYERRIRRIYPAVFAVIAFVLIVGTVLYGAPEYSNIGKSAISITLFLSNMFFWSESGYFEGPSTLKPLLHTWSLSVEEQFYIFFPLLLVLISHYFKSRFRSSIIVLLVISFIAGIYSTNNFRSAAFYFMPLRAWELLVGSLLVFLDTPINTSSETRNFLSFAGMLMIFTSIVFFSDETLFPGFMACIPVLGTAILLYFGMDKKNLSNRILNLTPLIFIGRISYSLYLWHWPLLVIGKYYLIRQLATLEIIVWLVVTFVLSTLSWRYIENPFRNVGFLRTARVFGFAGGIMLFILIVSFAIYSNNGFPNRFESTPSLSLKMGDSKWSNKNKCLTKLQKKLPQDLSLCILVHLGINGTLE